MKKLLFAAALAASLTGLADVTSANTVGYVNRSVEPGVYYMVAAQFEDVGSDSAADLNKVFNMTNLKASDYDHQGTKAPCIMLRVGSGYKFLYYINDAFDADDNPVAGDVWADDGYVLTAEQALALGDGFWFLAPEDAFDGEASISVAGQVSSATELGKNFNGSAEGYYSIVANTFPTATDLRDVKTTGLMATDYDHQGSSGNAVMVRIGSGYKFLYYINDAYDADDNPVTGDVWADDGYVVTEDNIIAPGNAFWIMARQNGMFTFSLVK